MKKKLGITFLAIFILSFAVYLGYDYYQKSTAEIYAVSTHPGKKFFIIIFKYPADLKESPANGRGTLDNHMQGRAILYDNKGDRVDSTEIPHMIEINPTWLRLPGKACLSATRADLPCFKIPGEVAIRLTNE